MARRAVQSEAAADVHAEEGARPYRRRRARQPKGSKRTFQLFDTHEIKLARIQELAGHSAATQTVRWMIDELYDQIMAVKRGAEVVLRVDGKECARVLLPTLTQV